MGWASHFTERLRKEKPVQFRPRGDSMRGKMEPGRLCTVEPVDPGSLQIGRVRGADVPGRWVIIDGRFAAVDPEVA